MSKDAINTKAQVAQPPAINQDVQLKGNVKPDGTGYKAKNYQTESKGVPVGPGETWHDLTLDERIAHMRNHENKWRSRFTKEAGAAQGSMNWTRG